MELNIRPVGNEELHEFVRVLQATAGYHADEDQHARAVASYQLDRTLAVIDGGRIVGGTGSDVLELTLPGLTTVRAARITETGVLPTHRRRGLLTALMSRQLDEVSERGEYLAMLSASEAGIYRRFGYGPATSAMSVEIDRAHVAFRLPRLAGRLWLLDADEAAELLPVLFNEHRRIQPGEVERTDSFWRAWLRDPERRRQGAGSRFVVAYEEAGSKPSGYASYRFRESWRAGTVERALLIEDLVASSTDARLSLWQYCLSVDLVDIIQAPNVPVDEPLGWMLANPRRLRVTGLMDFLWIRLVDFPSALAARRYAVPGRLVLEVADDFRPVNNGRYELEASPDGAKCQRTTRTPDLTLGASELGAAYLGGVSFSVLSRAHQVDEHIPGGLDRADKLFSCRPAPWCVTDW